MKSKDTDKYLDLVEKAKCGCRDSMSELSEIVHAPMYSYIYRLTLNAALSEDLVQETLLEMFKSLKNLKKIGSFNSWLYRTALGKVQHYYRSSSNKFHLSMQNKHGLINGMDENKTEGLKDLISKEIAETLVVALAKLDMKHRNALVLRCYENMSYAQIAETMECSEISARVLFYRAKAKMHSILLKKGITKSSFLLALGIFGKATAPSKAIAEGIVIVNSTLKAGFWATIIGSAMSKLGLTIISLLTAAAISVGTVGAIKHFSQSLPESLRRDQIKSFHYVKQAWEKGNIANANLLMGKSLSKGAYEQWYYFPEGVDGPMFKMMQRWDPSQTSKLCGWRQDASGNYYYHSGQKKIYRYPNPLGSLKTLRLPSDSPEFIEFLEEMEGKAEGVTYTRDDKTGLLTGLIDERFANVPHYKSDISYNQVEEKEFGKFRYEWSKDAEMVDERDSVHQKGWSFIEISGYIGNDKVTGRLRIPFNYKKSKELYPLLELKIGNLTAIDGPDGAFITDTDENVLAAYPSQSFFKGLPRPWYGMHNVDSLRRDAVAKRVPFSVENINYTGASLYEKMAITLDHPIDDLTIKYLISTRENQIINMDIQYIDDNDVEIQGRLEFKLTEDISIPADDMVLPEIRVSKSKITESPGIYWIFNFIKGQWSE